MTNRVDRALVLSALSLATLLCSGCAMFSQSASCSSPESTDLVAKMVGESPEADAVLLSAYMDNSEAKMMSVGLGMALSRGRPSDDLEPMLNTLGALGSSPKDFLSIDAIVTTETKSRRSVGCQAQVHLKPTPPQGVAASTWKVAAATGWNVEYSAALTDDGKQVLVTVSKSACQGPACELLPTVAPLAKELKGNKDALLASIKSARAAASSTASDAATQSSSITQPIDESESVRCVNKTSDEPGTQGQRGFRVFVRPSDDASALDPDSDYATPPMPFVVEGTSAGPTFIKGFLLARGQVAAIDEERFFLRSEWDCTSR